MMVTPSDGVRPPMTPQLALRVAIIGGCALVMFALIFFRLWFLQVLDSGHYTALAKENSTRVIPVAAPRGEIVGRNGGVLVNSVAVPAILIAPESLPTPIALDPNHPGLLADQPADDVALYGRLARVLGMSTRPSPCKFVFYPGHNRVQIFHPRLPPIECLVAQGVAASQYANVTVKANVPPDVRDYIAERQSDFPGVLSHDVFLRQYPLGDVGAQVFGTLGEMSETQYLGQVYPGVTKGSVVGQSGLEFQYNQYLQGTAGKERVKVNSDSQFEGYAKGQAPKQGDTLKLSLDSDLEKVAQNALQTSIQQHGGSGGAFVALDPQNGSVYAMGSAPSFNPSFFTRPFTQAAYDHQFRNKGSESPLLNRATQSVGPDGSTFKVITATAALQSGKWSADQLYDDTGEFCFPHEPQSDCKHNAGHAAYGSLDMAQAIKVSDDVYFYHLGYLLNGDPQRYPQGWPLQHWAGLYGLGQKTGIDLPAEAVGTLPSPVWRAHRNALEHQCDTATGAFAYTNAAGTQSGPIQKPGWHRSPTHPAGGCGIANGAVWTVGDNVNEGVGQGDVQITPLQLAVVYSAIANGGTIVTPHLGAEITSTDGRVIQNIDPAPKRNIGISGSTLEAIRQGLNMAAQSQGGTSDDVMGNFPKKVYGKTGTAQYGNAAQIANNTESDYAWYACYVPASETSKPIVIVVWVEKGGFGDVAAAPVARQMLNQWFLGKAGTFKSGANTDL